MYQSYVKVLTAAHIYRSLLMPSSRFYLLMDYLSQSSEYHSVAFPSERFLCELAHKYMWTKKSIAQIMLSSDSRVCNRTLCHSYCLWHHFCSNRTPTRLGSVTKHFSVFIDSERKIVVIFILFDCVTSLFAGVYL